ncbi:MAG: NAD(P)-binding domain-containing protein [Proteobacteria bacterium]|nr:NAD(P)-binding domain-containing protein [Pseudomonadota bacterium]
MRIAIIGAGCSGLTAIKQLAEAELHNIVCYEQGGQIGGNWVYTAAPGHSSISKTTHTIASKRLSQFSDFPMPDDYPDYPSHNQILAYFQAYAQHFHLKKYIRFNTAVLRAEKIANERWRLTLSDNNQVEFDYLIVANGHLSVPRHPDWKDRFNGQYLHAHEFKTNQGMENKNVLVVGAGNSGCDCAVEASRVAARVDLSLRTPQYIIPKLIMGKPTDTFAASMQWLPQTIKDWLQKISLRIQIGRYRDYMLPEPDFAPAQAHPTINSEIFDKIRHGKIHPRPGIQDISSQTVVFTDGSSVSYDVIIAATGYKISFPFFPTGFIDWQDAAHVPLYLRIFHPDHPSLFFIGLIQPQGCIWTLAEVQSRLIAQLLTGETRLPDDWREQAVAEGAYWTRQFIARPRHSLEVQYYPYLQQLLKAMQRKP